MEKAKLKIAIGKLHLKNPVLVASGTFGYGEEYLPLVDLSKLGAIVLKGISLKPKDGNPPPRIVETPSGMLNAIGLENVGLEAFIKEKIPSLRQFEVPLIANICGETEDEYIEIARCLDNVEGVYALELNISCPNVKRGGVEFGRNEKMASFLVEKVREETTLPLIAKLSPNVTDIGGVAIACQKAGADAISLINTFLAIAVDIETRKPVLGNITGGLSGPAIKPIALRMVWEVAGVVTIPIIGMGGIMSWQDGLEFLLAGATAIAVGTANFVNPRAPLEILEGIENYLEKNDIADVNSLRNYGRKWSKS